MPGEENGKSQCKGFAERILRVAADAVQSHGLFNLSVAVPSFWFSRRGEPNLWYSVVASSGGASHLFLSGQPLDRMLAVNPNSAEKFRSAILEVTVDRAYFWRLILDRVRP